MAYGIRCFSFLSLIFRYSTHEEIRTISTQIKAQLEYKFRKTKPKFKIHKGKKYQTLIEDDSQDTDSFYEAMTEYNLQESPLLIDSYKNLKQSK